MKPAAVKTSSGMVWADVFRWAGIGVILTIAILRCVVVFLPQTMFDVDPFLNSTPPAGFGPGGSLALDSIMLLGCGLALLGQALARKGVDWLLLALASAPIPAIMWHGLGDAGDLWIGLSWGTAVVAGVTIATVARDRWMRLMIVAVLTATLVPLLIRGANQMTFEHAETVKLFEERREIFLAERGWEPDSSAAQIYERRLRQPQPLGWFVTTNIFAGFVGFGLVLWTGLAISSVRAGMQSGWPGLMILGALLAGAALWMTGSKGALGATLIGMGVGLVFDIAFSKFIREKQDEVRGGITVARSTAAAVIALIAITLLAVVVHGTLAPERFRELSLLFRWHYMSSAARIFLEQPLVGVGPDGFQQAYMLHRIPTNPEEVTSAHSVFIDWLSMLGIAAFAWVALVVLFVWRAGVEIADLVDASGEPERESNGLVPDFISRTIGAIAVMVFVPAMLIELPVSDTRSLLLRALSAVGFAVLAVMMVHLMNRCSRRSVQIWLIAAMTAVLIHAQIEMTFYQPGAIAWLMCMLGVAGGSTRNSGSVRGRPLALSTAALLIIGGLGFGVFAARPAIQQERQMMRAADALHPARDKPNDVSLLLRCRQRAAAILLEAYETWPINVKPLEAAVVQLDLAVSRSQPGASVELLRAQTEQADRAVTAHGKPSSMALAITAHVRSALASNDQTHWEKAIAYARQMTTLDPWGISAWKRLGDVLWLAGDRKEAVDAYRRALQNSDRFAFDVLKQLSGRVREALQNRIEEAEAQDQSQSKEQ